MFLCRLTLCFVLLTGSPLAIRAGQPALQLELISLTRPDDSHSRVTFRAASDQPIAIDASSDLQSWTEITNAVPDASASITISQSNASHRFYRAVTHDAYFVGVIRSNSGEVLPAGVIALEATGQTYSADAAGEVKIATRFLPFSSGYRVRASAPGYNDQTVNISPFTYFYTFTLSAPSVGPAPETLSLIQVQVSHGGIGPANYNVALSGGRSGTFMLSGEGIGQGTYTYTPNQTTARLRLDFTGAFAGDFDDMTLMFNTTGGPHSFSGIQRASGSDFAFSGWFWVR